MGNIAASHTVEIDAPLSEVYAVAADVPGAVEWNPAMEKVDVIEKTTVIDRETGKVITTEKEVTPVTVTKEKEVETDVDVNVGETVKTVK